MGGLCNSVTSVAGWFLWAALFAAVAEIVVALLVKLPTKKADRGSDRKLTSGALGPILDALAKVLAALKDLPAWVAVFLAGLALVWTAASAPNLCA